MAFRHVYSDEEQVTAEDTQTPVESASLKTLLFGALNRIKSIMGTSSWQDNPPSNLQDLSEHIDSRDGHPLATPSENGLMASSDKEKLDSGSLEGNYITSDTTPVYEGDLNNISGQGFYRVNRNDSVNTNIPPNTSDQHAWIYLTQFEHATNYRMQIAEDYFGRRTHERTLINGAWSNWTDSFSNTMYVAHNVDDIKNNLLAASSAGGGTVVIAGQTTGQKTYVVDQLSIPSNVRLVSRGGVKIQSLPDNRSPMITMPSNSTGVRIEDLVIDHTPGYHGTVYYDAQTSPDYDGPVTIAVSGNHHKIFGCEILNSCMDGINALTGTNNLHVFESHVEGADRQGMNMGGPQTSPSVGVRVDRCTTNETYAAGLGAIGAMHDAVFSHSRVTNTGGSGDCLAAYSPYNDGCLYIGIQGRNLGNNGTHIGGDNIRMIGCDFTDCAGSGIIYESQHDLYRESVKIEDCRVVRPSLRGIQATRATDVTISSCSVKGSGQHHYQLVDTVDSDIIGCFGSGIQGTSGNNIRLSGASRVRIVGGTYDSAKGHAIYGHNTISLSNGGTVTSTNVKISNVDIRSASGNGVLSEGGANKWIVTNNDFTGNGAGISLVGNNNIQTPNLGA